MSPHRRCSRMHDEFTHFLGILMVEQTLRTSETIIHGALASNLQRTVIYTSMTRDNWLVTSCPDYLLQALSDTHKQACAVTQSEATQKLGVMENFWKHIRIQRPKIHQKQIHQNLTFFLMGQNLCWPVYPMGISKHCELKCNSQACFQSSDGNMTFSNEKWRLILRKTFSGILVYKTSQWKGAEIFHASVFSCFIEQFYCEHFQAARGYCEKVVIMNVGLYGTHMM